MFQILRIEEGKSGGIVIKDDKKNLEGFGKKKSKSNIATTSYSIAALCQMPSTGPRWRRTAA